MVPMYQHVTTRSRMNSMRSSSRPSRRDSPTVDERCCSYLVTEAPRVNRSH